MVLRRKRSKNVDIVEEPRGFDAFDLRLGDLMRGERATMGKSLLDVEREIRIRASYIAAIENADPDAFDTPGFIPGYVRSYARYLGMDPDEAFETFSRECGFALAHGMSAGASSIRKSDSVADRVVSRKDPIMEPATPFLPARESMLSSVEPGAIGSAVVLLGLIAGIGFGGWTVLKEVQQVRLAPVENTPTVLTDLDPLDGAVMAEAGEVASGFQPSNFGTSESLDRVYRPEALDVPVIVARDGPIATIDPSSVGTLTADAPVAEPVDPIEAAIASVLSRSSDGTTPTPQVLADAKPPLRVVAVRPAWIRVTSAEGNIVFEGTLNGGETYEVPALEEAPSLRVGESGSVYFQVADAHYGPVGPQGTITRNVALSVDALTERYDLADLSQDEDLSTYVAELELNGQ
ncbi:MAG: RodZ domain-containing protein [Pseudomonadota bacterium]